MLNPDCIQCSGGWIDTKKYETLQCCQWQEVARMKKGLETQL